MLCGVSMPALSSGSFPERVPFLVSSAYDLNFSVVPDSDVLRQSLIRGLARVHAVYPFLLTFFIPCPTPVEILPGAPGRDFYDDYDASYIGNGVRVVRNTAYVYESSLASDLSGFVIYDLLSKLSWSSASDIPFGLDHGTRLFFEHSFSYRTSREGMRSDWRPEEAGAAFFAMLVGTEQFGLCFMSGDTDPLSSAVDSRVPGLYRALCVMRSRELLECLQYAFSSRAHVLPSFEEFLNFGMQHGYDFSMLSSVSFSADKYSPLFPVSNIEVVPNA